MRRATFINSVRAAIVVGLFAVLGAVPAAAHVERPAYFPDPAPDTSVTPATGGKVPVARSLFTALQTKPPGTTRVVCQGRIPNRHQLDRWEAAHKRAVRARRRGRVSRATVRRLARRVRIARASYRRAIDRNGSMVILRQALARAQRDGYKFRPSEAARTLTRKQAQRILRFNERLLKACKFHEIQPAVTASGNNDRVVIMPGLYTEQTARSKPTNDKSCDQYKTNGDRPGEERTALSYAYQFHCPNDQNLIAVMGRALGPGQDPSPPRENRHGIPNLGPCIRCNLQIEGSGVTADDVIIEAGDASKGNRGPNGVGSKKDVGVRADRADGFVLRNVNVRHAGEHGIYVLESDGYLLERFKAFYSRLYGTLTFVEDHGLQQDCEAVGHGDSGIYPGAAVETGVQRPAGTEFRYNQEIRRCDMHHNLAGYSGTNGNAVHVRHNDIYDNSLGIQTDVVTGAGHPGYPGDSALFEENRIHSNNFNPYDPGSDVKPSFPFPVGTGLWIAGGNHHKVRGNRFYNNWRRGTMLFSVPDSLVCGRQTGNSQAGCEPEGMSTSHFNQQFENVMGARPDGTADPNGTDFWWDGFAGSRGNCWFRNTGPKAITTSPPVLPDCADGRDPSMSIGPGYLVNESELAGCVVAFETRTYDQAGTCPWFKTPAEPQPGARQRSATPPALGQPLPGTTPRAVVPAEPRTNVPLGQVNCGDWNNTAGSGRGALVERLRAFAGGVVNDGSKNVGVGATLSSEDAQRLFDAWCGRAYAQDFLLYKLYTHAAAFQHRG